MVSGKSVLASEALRDPDVTLKHFPDGVIWFRVGIINSDEKLLNRLRFLCEKLDSEKNPTDIEHAVEILKKYVRHRVCCLKLRQFLTPFQDLAVRQIQEKFAGFKWCMERGERQMHHYHVHRLLPSHVTHQRHHRSGSHFQKFNHHHQNSYWPGWETITWVVFFVCWCSARILARRGEKDSRRVPGIANGDLNAGRNDSWSLSLQLSSATWLPVEMVVLSQRTPIETLQ